MKPTHHDWRWFVADSLFYMLRNTQRDAIIITGEEIAERFGAPNRRIKRKICCALRQEYPHRRGPIRWKLLQKSTANTPAFYFAEWKSDALRDRYKKPGHNDPYFSSPHYPIPQPPTPRTR